MLPWQLPKPHHPHLQELKVEAPARPTAERGPRLSLTAAICSDSIRSQRTSIYVSTRPCIAPFWDQICPHQTSAIPQHPTCPTVCISQSIRVIQVAGVFEKVLEELCSYNSSHCTFWVLGTTVRTAPNCLNLCWNAGPTKTQIDDLIMPIYSSTSTWIYIYIYVTYVYIYICVCNTL